MHHEQPDLETRSPWSPLHGIRAVEINPTHAPIRGSLRVPGSKSFTNRALIIAGMAEGVSELTGWLQSDDSYWCVEALKALGTPVELIGETIKIHGTGAKWPNQAGTLFLGAAGTLARFLPGALVAAPAGEWDVQGGKRLSERPVAEYLEGLRQLGADIAYLGERGKLPVRVRAGSFSGGTVQVSGKVSSQFLSGLLLASPYARQPVDLEVVDHIVQHAYVHITLDLMRAFGVQVKHDDALTKFHVSPGKYQAQRMALEADASTAAYFFALAALTGGRMRVENLSVQTRQPDVLFVDILERMGCLVERGDGWIEVQGPDTLKGGFEISLRELSDQALTVAAVSVFADAPVTVTGVAHIRGHESDRIRAVCDTLNRVGIQAVEHEDGFTVYPGLPHAADLPSYDDHRVAMAFSLLGVKVPGIRVLDPGCVSKTCPTFYQLLQPFGVSVQLIPE